MEFLYLTRLFQGVPNLWSNRSLGALLLCIHCVDCKPVITYFKHLSSNDQMGMAIEILSNIFYMAPEYIASRNSVIQFGSSVSCFLNALVYLKDVLGFSYRSLFNLIRNAINCGWSTEDKQTLVQELWSDIREYSETLLELAIENGKHIVKKITNLNLSFSFFLLKEILKSCIISWKRGRRFVYI